MTLSFRLPTASAGLLLAALLLPCVVRAQQGSVREGLTMASRLLGAPVGYTVYLPPGYDAAQRAYPVVYLFHGYTDDDTAWIQYGEADRIVDAGIAAGTLPPMILVLPDGGVSWFINDHAGRVRWERMFVEEFLPHVEATFRVRKGKAFRALAGQSMGGYGALALTLRHPDLFASVAAFGSAVRTDDEVRDLPQTYYDEVYGPVFGPGRVGADRLTDHWRQYSALDLVRTLPVEGLRTVRYYLDCGDDDHFSGGSAALHLLMRQRGLPHEYRVRDGGHTWSYWRTALPDGLAFIGGGFHR